MLRILVDLCAALATCGPVVAFNVAWMSFLVVRESDNKKPRVLHWVVTIGIRLHRELEGERERERSF